MYVRTERDPQVMLAKVKRALQVSEGFTVDDLKAEPHQVSQPTPDDVPDDWAPIKRPGDFVTITEDPADIIPEPRQITADLDPPPPEEPNTPACDSRCADCDGQDHHWLTDIDHGYANDEPEHPAARAGLDAWDICKHCTAWRPITDEEPDFTTCTEPKCKGPREVVMNHGVFCRWHAIKEGRKLSEELGGQMPIFAVEPYSEELKLKIESRISATPQSKILHCPQCKSQHIDTGDWKEIPHCKHRCAYCKHEWKPFDYCTVGVSSMQLRGQVLFPEVTQEDRCEGTGKPSHSLPGGAAMCPLCGVAFDWQKKTPPHRKPIVTSTNDSQD